MKYNRLYAAFIFAFWAGCSGDGQYKEALLPQIDVNEEYPEKEIFLQDVADLFAEKVTVPKNIMSFSVLMWIGNVVRSMC